MYALFIPFCEVGLKTAFKNESTVTKAAFDVAAGIFLAASSLAIGLLI